MSERVYKPMMKIIFVLRPGWLTGLLDEAMWDKPRTRSLTCLLARSLVRSVKLKLA